MPRSCRPAAAALALALTGLLAGCGPSDDARTTPQEQPTGSAPATPPSATPPSPTSQSPTPPSADAEEGPTALTVTVADGAGLRATRTLTCDPVGGDVPDPAAACAALAEAGPAALEPPRGDLRCTMEFGGPQTATVTGTVRGRPVTADLDRTNGCEIARWDALAPLLGVAAGGPDS